MSTDAEDIALLDEIATHRREIERLRSVVVDMGERIAELQSMHKARRISRAVNRLTHDLRWMVDEKLFESSDDFGITIGAAFCVLFDRLDVEGEGFGVDGGEAFEAFLSAMVQRKIARDGVGAGATQN
jgi:hypothetical protein